MTNLLPNTSNNNKKKTNVKHPLLFKNSFKYFTSFEHLYF